MVEVVELLIELEIDVVVVTVELEAVVREEELVESFDAVVCKVVVLDIALETKSLRAAKSFTKKIPMTDATTIMPRRAATMHTRRAFSQSRPFFLVLFDIVCTGLTSSTMRFNSDGTM